MDTSPEYINMCSELPKETQVVHFSFGNDFGKLMTDTARQMAWWECKREKAILFIADSVIGITTCQVREIIDGTKKLVTAKDRKSIKFVNDNWEPPLREIGEKEKIIADALAYIQLPGHIKDCGSSPAISWLDYLQNRIQLQLHAEGREILRIKEYNIWEAGERAKSLREWAEEEMGKNVGIHKEDDLDRPCPANKNNIDKVKSEVLDDLYAKVAVNIATSGMPMDVQDRLLSEMKGQRDAFVEGVEITLDNDFKYDTGWLDEDGNYYGCLMGQHIPLGQKLVDIYYPGYDGDSEQKLENERWIKCTGGMWYCMNKDGKFRPTPSQMNTIGKWAKKWGEPFRWNGGEMTIRELKER